MTHRVYNFNPGPATLPLPVLEEVREELLDFRGTGMSIMETSHRSPEYSEVHDGAASLALDLLGLSADDYAVLFLGGGASTQFYMIPQNLLAGGGKADYVRTGTWAKKAIQEAKLFGDVHIAHDAEDEQGRFAYVPAQDQLDLRDDAVYLHFTSNNTIAGTQFHEYPEPPEGVLLVADMSSDMLWREFDASRFAIIYAGAQKNLGPSGVTMVVFRRDVLDRCADGLPTMVSYRTHVEKNSLFNTPPCFPIYVVGKVLRWIEREGGLAAMGRKNREKGDLLYDLFDANPGFFRTPVRKDSRSYMNVVWRLPTEELERMFIAEAKDAGLVGLKGHRSVGGCRASIYNAMTLEGVKALADFLRDFVARHG